MTTRIEQELALLSNRFPRMTFLADGLWCRLPGYVIPGKQLGPSGRRRRVPYP